MKLLYQLVGIALVIFTSTFFLLYFVDNWSLLSTKLIDIKTLPTIITITFFYLTCFLLTSIAWYILLNSVNEKPKLIHIVTITLLSQFGKYLPGNVGHHVGRVVLAHNAGLSNRSIAITMLLELIIVILAAGGTGLLALSLDSTILSPNLLDESYLAEIFLFFLIIITLLTYLLLQKPVSLGRLYSLYKIKTIRLPKLLPLINCVLLYTTNFLILGFILYLIMSLLTSGVSGNFWLLTGVFSIAWITGFVTPGAPAGLGVREAIIISALDPVYGPGVALSLAVSLRIITTIGDGTGLLIGLVLRQWTERNTYLKG